MRLLQSEEAHPYRFAVDPDAVCEQRSFLPPVPALTRNDAPRNATTTVDRHTANDVSIAWCRLGR